MAENKFNNVLKLRITTQSNVLMGGADSNFEIGGIDQSTVVNINGEPYIPASAFKGILKRIMSDCNDTDNGQCVRRILKKYLEDTERKLLETLESKKNNVKGDNVKIKQIDDLKEKVKKVYTDEIQKLTSAGVLGIQNIQQVPKVIFTDFEIKKGQNKVFSIDNKNSIDDENDVNISSNPRTYRTIGKNVIFEGKIYFYDFDKFGEDADKVVNYIKEMLLKFNDGIYRIGNSKSRGYGKIKLEIVNE